jgi:TonB family protein
MRVAPGVALVLAGLLSTLGAARAAAQATPDPAACGRDAVVKDTVRQIVYFTLRPTAGKPKKGEPAEPRSLYYGQVLAPYFRVPAAVTLDQGRLGLLPDQAAVDGLLAFLVMPDGRVDSASVVTPTRSLQLDTALLAAVRRADSAGAFRELAAERTTGDTVILRVTAAGTPPVRTVPLFRLRLDNAIITEPAKLVEEPPIVFPRGAPEQAGAGDDLTVQFIVGLDGRVEPESIRFTGDHDRDFALAERNVLLGTRYQPARVGSCPVRQLVEFSIGVDLQRVPR